MNRPYSAHGCYFNVTCFKLMQSCSEHYQFWWERIQTFLVYNFMNVKWRARDFMIWLVGCFGFNGPLRQYFSLNRAVS